MDTIYIGKVPYYTTNTNIKLTDHGKKVFKTKEAMEYLKKATGNF